MKEKAVVITTNDEVRIVDMERDQDGFLLKDLQQAVGGFTEIVHPMYLERPYVVICDDEGVLKHKQLNRIASHWYGGGMVGDIVVMKEGFYDGEPDIVGLNEFEAQMILNRASELKRQLA